ncbi:MAG: tetratricopeptide repeat protein [Candidatus Scalindua sp.]|nr:tetratricopeptide repeat protein [Candidatus Scalindua sp.]
MRKHIRILLLTIFGMVNLCFLNNALSVEKHFGVNDENEAEAEIAVMLKTLERERTELGKLRSEFKGTVKMIEDESEVLMGENVEKENKVVLANFVKKSVGKREKSLGRQNSFLVYKEDGEAAEINTLQNEGEYVEESEKLKVDSENEIIHPFEIAENLYKLGEYQTALDIYQLIVKDNITEEKKMWISYQIANCYKKLNSYNEAVEAYSEMLEVYEGTYWAKQAQWNILDIEWRAEVEKKLEKVVER